MKNSAALLVLCSLLFGCWGEPKSKESTDNPDFKVSVLFSHDGCTVYRFVDGSGPHYYAKCSGATATSDYRIGKRRGSITTDSRDER